MALTTAEQESLRFHLGYGNIGPDAAPYTEDGFYEVFSSIISPNLSTGTETTATTAVSAGAVTTVTPVSMTGIALYGQLVVDVGSNAEVVMVQAAGATTFAAKFAKAHSASGYPIATMSGLARVRMLLWDADEAWRDACDVATGKTAGIKSADKADVVFFGTSAVSQGKLEHYKNVVRSISRLVRVRPSWDENSGRCSRMEAY